jgi:hypothetical protein
VAHSCERAQVSGKQRYSRGFGACNRQKACGAEVSARFLAGMPCPPSQVAALPFIV